MPSGKLTVPSQSPSNPSYGEPGVGTSASARRVKWTPPSVLTTCANECAPTCKSHMSNELLTLGQLYATALLCTHARLDQMA